MNLLKMGEMIRTARQKKRLTQLQLARLLRVSDKTVSKWERGCGAPDLSSLPLLAEILQLDLSALIAGKMEEHDMRNGNMKKLRFYVCPVCGNLLFATDEAQISCCGQKLSPLPWQKAAESERLTVEITDDEYFITALHEMSKEHYISFVALLTGDTVMIRKQYPEWGLETRLPYPTYGTLLWYCTQHGLFYQPLPPL